MVEVIIVMLVVMVVVVGTILFYLSSSLDKMERITVTLQDYRAKRGNSERTGLPSMIAHEENWSRASTELPSHHE